MGTQSRLPDVAVTSPLRLLTLTTLFPNSQQPRHGIFIANRLRRICDTGRVRAHVIAAVPSFPGWYRSESVVPEAEALFGFDVRHPRYLHVPMFGMRMQPDMLARALLDDLRKTGLDADRFDAIDAHYFYPDGVAAARVANELGLPLVISARGSDINLIGGIPFARKRMLDAASSAQALIAVSRALSDRMMALGMASDRIVVLRNGVDPEMFAPFPREEARARLGLMGGASWVLGVGSLVPGKGFDILIGAMKFLPEARLLIVGQGRQRAKLESLAAAIAPSRVEFRDNMSQSELRFAYGACDVLGLPSEREGWPNVVLESIACGTPVVASPVGGIPEILGADAPGRLVHDHEPRSWASAILSLMDACLQPDQVRQYALKFEWENVVAQQCAVYEQIVSTHRRGRKGVHA